MVRPCSGKVVLIWIGVLMAGFFLPTACKNERPPAREITGPYKNEAGGYSIQFPSGWKIRSGIEGADVVALAPPAAGDKYRANIVVLVENLSADADLPRYHEAGLHVLRKGLYSFSQTDVGGAELAGRPAVWLEYFHSQSGKRLSGLNYITILNGRGYVIAATTAAEEFEALEESLRAAALSLRLF